MKVLGAGQYSKKNKSSHESNGSRLYPKKKMAHWVGNTVNVKELDFWSR